MLEKLGSNKPVVKFEKSVSNYRSERLDKRFYSNKLYQNDWYKKPNLKQFENDPTENISSFLLKRGTDELKNKSYTTLSNTYDRR